MPGRSYQLKHLPEFVGHWTQGVAIAIGHQLLHDLFGHLPECIGHTGLLLPSDINYCMTFSDICQRPNTFKGTNPLQYLLRI
jgi:hypothetical protein